MTRCALRNGGGALTLVAPLAPNGQLSRDACSASREPRGDKALRLPIAPSAVKVLYAKLVDSNVEDLVRVGSHLIDAAASWHVVAVPEINVARSPEGSHTETQPAC